MFLYWDEELFCGSLQNKHVLLAQLWNLEFIALELADQEAEWLKSFLTDIPLWGKQ